MNETDPLSRFLSNNRAESERLVKLLFERKQINEDQRDALYLALIDIAESVQKAYGEIIPAILALQEPDDDALWEAMFDLRSEFRHIDYHIHDASLDEL